jgi:hypothetical protein
MPSPGQVYFLPPIADEGPLKGARPYLTLTPAVNDDEVVTLAYGSTRDTDAVNGAAHVLVDPARTKFGRTGLVRPTYFYPSRLLGVSVGELPHPAGRVVREMPLVLKRLRQAVGVGSGATRDPNRPGTNRRGRIAHYSEDLATELGTRFCLIVTEPAYSRRSHQQITIPLLSPADFEPVRNDVLIRCRPPAHHADFELLAAVSLVFSVFERTHLKGYLDRTAEAASMRAVDVALTAHFGL